MSDDKGVNAEFRQSIRDLRSMPDYLNGLSAWLRSFVYWSGDYRDSDLYRELWADKEGVVDGALHEALGLQEYLIGLNLPNTAAKLDSR